MAPGEDSSALSNPTPVDDTLAEVDARIEALKNVKRVADRVQKVISSSGDPEIESLEQAEAALSLALTDKALAAVVPRVAKFAADAKAQLASLKSERIDIRRRREGLARLAQLRGWPTAHTGEADHVGPFTLHHAQDATTITYASLRIARLKYPSPALIANAIATHERKLDMDARHHFEQFLDAAAREQETSSKTEAVPWPAIIEALIPRPAERKRIKRVLLWRLGLLLSGRAPGGWRIESVPPNLQEMPRAWSVPRLDRPNDALRMFRVRLIRDEGATSGDAPTPKQTDGGGMPPSSDV